MGGLLLLYIFASWGWAGRSMGHLTTVVGDGDIWRSSRALGLYGWVYIKGSVGPLHILITVYFPPSSTFARTDA